jgi:DNA repair protein RecN (Recombination protein N)
MQLRELCDSLIDIHGQHEHQSLQRPQVQRQLLDAFVGDSVLQDEVRSKYRAWQELEQKLRAAQAGSRERQQRIDLLGLYCDELNQLNLGAGEFETLLDEYKRLSNAGRLLEKTGAVLAQLHADEDQDIQSALASCEQQLGELLEYDPALAASHELIAAALIQVQEAGSELRAYRDSVDLDDARLAALNQRIATAQSLARKHRVDIPELIELGAAMNQELAELQGDDYDIDALQKALARQREAYDFSATELSRKRQQTASMLSEQITRVMQELGMSGGSFVIDVKAGDEPTAQGIDEIRYLVSANPGQPPKSLARVASGGELSRISLAIQVIMSETSQIPTLIFDEVDSGVGGGVAEIVGKKLRLLGRERQVLCVTHLPQVASQAHHHFRVEKSTDQQQTTTAVFALDDAERLEEVARMLGGVQITAQTRAHASEMIATSD